MGDAAAVAFEAEAARYDDGFGRNPVGLVFRHVFQQRLLAVFRVGAQVVDLGCGTGDDAAFLAERGVRVRALDVSPAMVERTRAKALARGLPAGALLAEVCSAESVASLQGSFDGAFSDFGALNCADLRRVGEGLAAVLRPGAPVLLSLMGPRPLPHALKRLLTGRGERRGESEPRVSGLAVPVRYPSAAQVRAQLGPGFVWRDAFALGVLIPDPAHAAWVREHPQAFGILASLEGRVRRWPVLRGLGDHLVLQGARAS